MWRWLVLTAIASLVVAGTAVLTLFPTRQEPTPSAQTTPTSEPTPAGGVIERACALDHDILVRIWRGYDESQSPDITIVPKEPNFWGSFTRSTHTGPWDYLQEVPLVLYGPERITASGQPLREHVNVTDIYATVESLLGVKLPLRTSTPLDDALATDAGGGPPKLIVVLVWDGVGRNVLKLWPDRWPNLARLEREGTSYLNATVGSSPSVTPATHTNMSTGAFPRDHKVVTIEYRGQDGEIHNAFERSDPRQLELTTFPDEVDRLYDNESKVGLLGWSVGGLPPSGPEAWTTNHLGFLGHGAAIPGGDRDEVALIGDTGNITANPAFYSLPPYLEAFGGLEEHAAVLDRDDGTADGKWLGHDILATHDNPAWVAYELDIMKAMIRKSNYGADNVPDILMTNFKMTDIAAHTYTIDSRELAEALEAQDEALGQLIEFLDAAVEDYALILTADHGHTRAPEKTGAWPVEPNELIADIDARFGAPADTSLVQGSEPVGLYIDPEVARSLDVEAKDVARFVNEYTIRDNWTGELPDGYEDRGSERIVATAFPSRELPRVMECAFGTRKPPADLDA